MTAPTLSSIAVAPVDPVLGYRGAPQQFRATGRYSDQSTRDLTNEVTWSSSDPAVAVIGADGFARAAAVSGSSTIRAQSGNVSASTTLSLRTATVSGEVVFPDSSMGWKPSLYDYQAREGGKVRVLGTDITVDIVPTSATRGTFSIAGVPWGSLTLQFEEGGVL
ncbi:MAG: Ig-like domain-containing protein, partial [Gammaproteobacteria bacterium]|nr:Ig-like domain-containing protein [Gammaproteobacteria bacterium]